MTNVKNAKVKTALAAVTLAAATLATPLSAQAQDYRDYDRKCSDTSNAVLGAVVGGTAGAAIGDRIAGRGQSTEVGILGAIIGGVAGAAVGDSASDCENYNRRNGRTYSTTTTYPSRTYGTTTTYPTRTYGTTTTYPTRTTRTHTTTPARTVYTSPRTVYHTSTTHNRRGLSNREFRLKQIDREIDNLRYERARLKSQRDRSWNHNPRIDGRLHRIAQRLDDLKRERKFVKKYGTNSHHSYRSSYPRGHH